MKQQSKRALAIGLILIAILTGLSAILFLRLMRHGFSAHDEPSMMEEMMARRMRAWSVPADLRDAKNPVALTPEVLAEARAHWADHCAVCHGNDGKGDTAIGRNLYPKAPDMTLRATQELSDGEIFSIIENGIRMTGMPGWGAGTAESAYGSWTLVHFTRHLPKLTPAELEEMKLLNPMTPAQHQQLQEEREFLEGGELQEPEHGASGHVH